MIFSSQRLYRCLWSFCLQQGRETLFPIPSRQVWRGRGASQETVLESTLWAPLANSVRHLGHSEPSSVGCRGRDVRLEATSAGSSPCRFRTLRDGNFLRNRERSDPESSQRLSQVRHKSESSEGKCSLKSPECED